MTAGWDSIVDGSDDRKPLSRLKLGAKDGLSDGIDGTKDIDGGLLGIDANCLAPASVKTNTQERTAANSASKAFEPPVSTQELSDHKFSIMLARTHSMLNHQSAGSAETQGYWMPGGQGETGKS
jgi:hypothetical protein